MVFWYFGPMGLWYYPKGLGAGGFPPIFVRRCAKFFEWHTLGTANIVRAPPRGYCSAVVLWYCSPMELAHSTIGPLAQSALAPLGPIRW